jgi:hypothetical protein
MIDYAIGTRLIYLAFPWSLAEHAGAVVESAALRHGCGVSGHLRQ